MQLSGLIPRAWAGRVPKGGTGKTGSGSKCFSKLELVQSGLGYLETHKHNTEHQEAEIY